MMRFTSRSSRCPRARFRRIRRFKWISENYFETMGNPVLAGRPITWSDIRRHASVCVVTENFAREYWDSPAEAVGKRIRASLDDPVAGDHRCGGECP